MTTTEIRCPKCNSNQLTANKKGFSGTKAVTGAILTGGVGLLAGTIGSNKVKITCLACGKEFKPGEGRTITIPDPQNLTNSDKVTSELNEVDQRVLELCNQKGLLQAVQFYKNAKGIDLKSSKEYVENLAKANGVVAKKGACFVATACYGNYDAPEVEVLRRYRDEILLRNFLGEMLVKFYYSISPYIARRIEKSDFLKKIVKLYLLQPIIKICHNRNKMR
jgi:hypothetical protein